mgnify:FL=1
MPQLAIAPIAPQAPASTASPTAPASSSSFSPHLDQAIKNTSPSSRNSARGEEQNNSQGSSAQDEVKGKTVLQEDGETAAAATEMASAANLGELLMAALAAQTTIASPATNAENATTGSASLASATAAAGSLAGGAAPGLVQAAAALLAAAEQGAQGAAAVLATGENGNGKAGPSPAGENPLLQQLQQIIDSGDKAVDISISSASNTTSISTASGEISLRSEAQAQAPITVILQGEGGAAQESMPLGQPRLAAGGETSAPNQPSRLSLQQQYIEGRMALEAQQEKQNNASDGQQQQQQSPGQTAKAMVDASLASGTGSLPGDSPSAFTQPLAMAQEGLKPQVYDSSRPLLLPSGTMVQQEEVIRQIAERFQISRREADTRINLQLHPAELGELRIDLSVKNGTVRANVVASTQVAQDILEKNMNRLRTVLESQGFSIDEILVSSSSRSVDDFNLFDQQLFGGSDYNPPSSADGRKDGAVFSMEGLTVPQAAAGLDVKA